MSRLRVISPHDHGFFLENESGGLVGEIAFDAKSNGYRFFPNRNREIPISLEQLKSIVKYLEQC